MSKLFNAFKDIANDITKMEDLIKDHFSNITYLGEKLIEEKKRTITVKDFTTEVLLKELLKREVGNTNIEVKTEKESSLKQDPDSIKVYLPTIGLKPIKTTDYLVAMGYLDLVEKDYEKAPVVKVPTLISDAIFEARHNNGLYITDFGKKVFDGWIANDCIPEDCYIKKDKQ